MVWTGLSFVFGLCFGSLVNVLAYRIPRNLPTALTRSQCPHCHCLIAWYDNIPLLSYVVLNGRCRRCREPISARYPLVEFSTAVLFAAIQSRYGESFPIVVAGTLATTILMTISLIDFDHFIIPDLFSLSLLAVGLILSPWNPFLGITPLSRFLQSFLGVMVGGGILWILAIVGEKIFRKEAMGGGDIKLLAGVGSFLGCQGVLNTLFLASLAGSFFGLVLMAAKRKRREEPVPFGPFLAGGALCDFLFFGPLREMLWQFLGS